MYLTHDVYVPRSKCTQFLNGDVWPYGNYFHNISGSNDYDNLMNTDPPASISYFGDYLNQPAVRQVGVGWWVLGVGCWVWGAGC